MRKISLFTKQYLIYLLFLFQSSVFSQNLKMDKEWTSNVKSFLESAPTVADIDNDGRDEILVAGQEEMIALDKNGDIIWRWKTRRRFMTYPTVLKREKETALIYAADNSGQMTCLNGKGKVVWQADLKAGAENSASVVADIDNNGSYEVIQADMSGTIWMFDALNGKVVNQGKMDEGLAVSPAVGDINGDGKLEVVIATNNGVISVLSSELKLLWKYKIGASSATWSTSAPVIFSASDGETYILAASSVGDVYCINNIGKPVWKYPTKAPIASTISVGDFNQNGVADIFLITQTGVIYRFDENGSKLWNIDMQGRSLAPGAIIDINNDNKLEYVFSTQRGNMFVLDNDCEVIFNHQFNSRTINVTPSFGKISSSSSLDVVLTGGGAGLAYCLNTPAKANTMIHWSSYRGNINNTGAWFGLLSSDNLRMVPQNLAWDKVFIGEEIKFKIHNPKPNKYPLRAEAECIDPNGVKYTSLSNVYGKEGELLFPVDFILPGNYKFTWKLINEKGKTLIESKKSISIQPFSNDQALVTQAISEINSTIAEVESVLPLSVNALRSTASDLQLIATNLSPKQRSLPRSSASEIQNTVEQTKELNSRAEDALKICDVIGNAKALGSRTSVIAFEGRKWENRNVDKQLPNTANNPVLIERTAVIGEHSPIPVMLFNITDQLLNVRVVYENKDSIKITPLRSINTISSMGNESWDPMPELDESAIVTIPPLKSREVWLDLDLALADAGDYKIEVIFQSLNGAGIIDAPSNPHGIPADETKVEISLEVLPFEMAPSGDFRLCTWSPSKGFDLESLLSHGNNVFIVGNGEVEYNSSDEIVSIDYSEIDEVINQLSGHDVFLLFHGLPNIKGEFGSEIFTKDYQQYLIDLVNHLSEQGIDLNHFALYAIDEPGGHGWYAVNEVIKVGEIAHEVNPEIMIYQDGGGELSMFEAMSKHLDVWVPPFEWLALDKPEMDVMRNTGKLLWSYNCSYTSARPVGANVKNINLFYEFRMAALLAMRNGSTGIGFWAYKAGSENQWSRNKLEYSLVYPGTTKNITSRRWEAVREGIEDYRILKALHNYSNEKDADSDVKEIIDHLIAVSLPQLVDPSAEAVKYGQPRSIIDNLASEEKMDQFREEMIECVKSVVTNEQNRKK